MNGAPALRPADASPESRWAVRRVDVVALATLFAVALIARAGMVLASSGGLRGNLGDDSAAYYAGADAIIHGRLPYRDFVLLHPPLLDLLLTPFAALGVATTDHVGFVTATVVFQVVGALDAVLVVVLARRFGLHRPAAFAAGTFYAVWYGAVAADVGIRLESPASTFGLVGLLALTGEHRARNALLGGAAFGAAATVKIWGVVPVVVLVIWLAAFPRTRRAAALFLGGSLGALVAVCAPFLLAAPGPTWRMIVTDQLSRPADRAYRVDKVTGLFDVFRDLRGTALSATCVVIGVVLAAVFADAARVAATRPVLVLALAEITVLLAAPSFYTNYLGYVAASLAITVGAAVEGGRAAAVDSGRAARASIGRVGSALAIAGAATLTLTALADVPYSVASRPFPQALLDRAVAGAHCPTPDGPMVLIGTDTLSSTLAAGCPNWVDVTGRVYDVDRPPAGRPVQRAANRLWQQDLRHYLLSGDVVILFRPKLGIGPALAHEIDRLPLIGSAEGYRAYRVVPGR